MTLEQYLPYIYGGVSLLVIVLLYIAYTAWRIKKIILKELSQQDVPGVYGGQYPQRPTNYPY